MLSVVIPVRNGVPLLRETINSVLKFLKEGDRGELIIVSDGCTDDPASFLASWVQQEERLRFECLERHRGKGAAVRRGVISARGDRIAYLDVDLSAKPEMLTPLMQSIDAGADIACGSRHVSGSRIDNPQGVPRVILGALFRKLVQMITKLPVKDTQCGCKLFRKDKLLPIFDQLTEEGFAFDIELLLASRRNGLVIEEVPIVWSDGGSSSVKPIRDGMRMLSALIRLARLDRSIRSGNSS
ncbi:MAG: glycosyltransferase [Planctomycetota bacterium]|nr:glycosyltransferase [Planctomycetota bacterium]